jgi:hypothetical protein
MELMVSSLATDPIEHRNGLFAIKVDFDKEHTNPSKMFLAISNLTNALQSIDETLIKTFNLSIEPVTLVENIQQGSVLLWLKNALQSVDDDAIKDLEIKKFVGAYLVKAKYIIIDFISRRTEIKGIEEIDHLKAELITEAENSGVNSLSVYSPVNTRDLLDDIGSISNSISLFDEFTKVTYCLPDSQAVTFNTAFNISPETIEEIATKDIFESHAKMILKVKRPDYLGDAKWEFRHGKMKIEARINDSDWLEQFRTRRIDLRPGDSLEAEVTIETKYDHNDEVITTSHIITRVYDVRPMTTPLQYDMNLSEENIELDSE